MFSSVLAARGTNTPDSDPSDGSRLSAESFVRKMRGGSQSLLLKASDEKLYVVKLNGGPQGTNVLANEALGSMLAEQLGLPVAAHTTISVSDQFLDSNPEAWFEMQSGHERPAAGSHYASLLIEGNVYEVLPRSWFSRIENRKDFLGMLMLDTWCGNTDNRQAIFVESEGDRSLQAIFIDHGHMFSGPDGKSMPISGAAQFLEHCIYDGLFSEEEIGDWMRKIWAVTAETAYTLASSIPVAWSSAPLTEVIPALLSRREQLAALISQQAGSLQERAMTYRKRNHAANQPVRVHCDRVRKPIGSEQVSLSAA